MYEIFCDYETKSRAPLPKCGAWKYSRDESTDVFCLAAKIVGEEGHILWVPGNGVPERLREPLERADTEWHAHNAAFEHAISTNVMANKYGWPKIASRQWHCTAARCAALGLPRSLGMVAWQLGIEMQKDAEGHKLMLKMCKPRKPTKNNPEEWFDSQEMRERLYTYCLRDVDTEMAVHEATIPLIPGERQLFLLDQEINLRGIPIDMELARAAIKLEAMTKVKLEARLIELTDGFVSTGNQLDKIIFWLRDHGFPMDNLKKDTVRDALMCCPAGPVRDVLKLRQQLSRSSVRKYQKMLDMADEDGRVRGAHLFFGGHTGRWAGKGVQFQNLPRGMVKPRDIDKAVDLIKTGDPTSMGWTEIGDIPDVLSSMIRPTVQAPEGKQLIVCDYNAVEPRVLAWLAGERWLLETFFNDEPVYERMASIIFNRAVEAITPDQRNVGKVAVLGLGFGMAAGQFEETCAKYGIDLAKAGIDPVKVVKSYRYKNCAIKQFWYRVEDTLARVVRTGDPASCNKLTFTMGAKALAIRLPSGRSIYYPDPTLRERPGWNKKQFSYMGQDPKTKKWGRLDSYGARVVENVAQGIARDLLGESMFRLRGKGIDTTFHVHDEIVSEVPDGPGWLERVEKEMSKIPAWARGCPIKATGYAVKRYIKQ